MQKRDAFVRLTKIQHNLRKIKKSNKYKRQDSCLIPSNLDVNEWNMKLQITKLKGFMRSWHQKRSKTLAPLHLPSKYPDAMLLLKKNKVVEDACLHL